PNDLREGSKSAPARGAAEYYRLGELVGLLDQIPEVQRTDRLEAVRPGNVEKPTVFLVPEAARRRKGRELRRNGVELLGGHAASDATDLRQVEEPDGDSAFGSHRSAPLRHLVRLRREVEYLSAAGREGRHSFDDR